jgi:uncharacterized coiled-coil protein SlyX
MKATRTPTLPDLSQAARQVQAMRQPVIIVQRPTASETKLRARLAALEESQAEQSTKIAELQSTLRSVKRLAQAKEHIEQHTTPKHHIVITGDSVFVADGLNLNRYARVKLPLIQAVKRWLMGR